jgi:hypothetical protein
MTAALIDQVMTKQSELADAIAAQDVHRIVCASEALAVSVSALKASTTRGIDDKVILERLQLAIQQNHTDTRKLNLLRHWTRQRIDRLNELRAVKFA